MKLRLFGEFWQSVQNLSGRDSDCSTYAEEEDCSGSQCSRCSGRSRENHCEVSDSDKTDQVDDSDGTDDEQGTERSQESAREGTSQLALGERRMRAANSEPRDEKHLQLREARRTER
jgi:hypothetical protein